VTNEALQPPRASRERFALRPFAYAQDKLHSLRRCSGQAGQATEAGEKRGQEAFLGNRSLHIPTRVDLIVHSQARRLAIEVTR
jgi:hypothetical protein